MEEIYDLCVLIFLQYLNQKCKIINFSNRVSIYTQQHKIFCIVLQNLGAFLLKFLKLNYALPCERARNTRSGHEEILRRSIWSNVKSPRFTDTMLASYIIGSLVWKQNNGSIGTEVDKNRIMDRHEFPDKAGPLQEPHYVEPGSGTYGLWKISA